MLRTRALYPIRVQTHYYICRNLQIIFAPTESPRSLLLARLLLVALLLRCFFFFFFVLFSCAVWPYRQPHLVIIIHTPRPHRPRYLGSNALLVVMSLNGLDNPDVLEAYQSALTEAGGW